jgi:hypothetical protein
MYANEQEIVAQAEEQTRCFWLTGCQICDMIGNCHHNNLLRNYWLLFAAICSRKYKIEFLVDYQLCRRMCIIMTSKECVTSLLRSCEGYMSVIQDSGNTHLVYPSCRDDKYYVYNIFSVFRPIIRKCIHQEYLLTGP